VNVIVRNGSLFLVKQYLKTKETPINTAIKKNGVLKSKKKNTELPTMVQRMLSHVLPSSISLNDGIVMSASPIIPTKGINILTNKMINDRIEKAIILIRLLLG
jgi:hypothetical protein